MTRHPAVALALASAVAWADAPVRLYALALGTALVTALSAVQCAITLRTDRQIARMLTAALREATRAVPRTPPKTPGPGNRGGLRVIGRDSASDGAS